MDFHPNRTDVVVIGAGQAGLATSYFLTTHGIDHVVLERGRIGESWHSQRWDSFVLNTPNWVSLLPGEALNGRDPDAFMSRHQYFEALNAYAARFGLPVREQVRVVALEKQSGGDGFLIHAKDDSGDLTWHCRQAVIASGAMSRPKRSHISAQFPEHIRQLHAAEFRSADALPPGSVLVVGGGQSGCQIAEDLLDADRAVFLATSRVGRVPRRYRDKDIFHWLVSTGLVEVPTDTITDPAMLAAPQPLSSGTGPRGHTISLQQLHRRGVTLLGRIEAIRGGRASFSKDSAEHVRFGDHFSANAKSMIDRYIEKANIAVPPKEADEADRPDPDAVSANPLRSLELARENITSVIWATGFDGDFGWIQLPIVDAQGRPIHRNGITSVAGVQFVGFPWLRKRKSGIIYGIAEDAEIIATQIARLIHAGVRTDGG